MTRMRSLRRTSKTRTRCADLTNFRHERTNTALSLGLELVLTWGMLCVQEGEDPDDDDDDEEEEADDAPAVRARAVLSLSLLHYIAAGRGRHNAVMLPKFVTDSSGCTRLLQSRKRATPKKNEEFEEFDDEEEEDDEEDFEDDEDDDDFDEEEEDEKPKAKKVRAVGVCCVSGA
jgi:hypothetical protein